MQRNNNGRNKWSRDGNKASKLLNNGSSHLGSGSNHLSSGNSLRSRCGLPNSGSSLRNNGNSVQGLIPRDPALTDRKTPLLVRRVLDPHQAVTHLPGITGVRAEGR